MIKQRFRVHLQDECPSIGTGRRIVEAELGHKWVYISIKGRLTRTRMKRSIWDYMKPQLLEESKP